MEFFNFLILKYSSNVGTFLNALIVIALIVAPFAGIFYGMKRKGTKAGPLLALLGVMAIMFSIGIITTNGLWYEAIFVGVLFVAAGWLASYVVMSGSWALNSVGLLKKPELPAECMNWNQNSTMEWSLFIAGVIGHFALESLGVNKLYCDSGVACQA